MVNSFALERTDTRSVTCQQIWGRFWQSQQAALILVQCGQMVSSFALDLLDSGKFWTGARQQIWDQFWQSQRAMSILVQCGQMVSSFALETTDMGSVTCQQIWGQFGQSQRAIGTLVQRGQMVSSSALERNDAGQRDLPAYEGPGSLSGPY